MRKVETREEAERKQKRNTLVVSIVLIAILVFSTAGYFSLSDEEETGGSSQGSSKVKDMGNGWAMDYNGQALSFSSSPDSASNASISLINTLGSYAGQDFYIASDNEAVTYEISYNLGRFAERVQPACYGACDKNLPEKGCKDNLIVFKEAAQNRVYQNDNCVFIEGSMSAADAFLYKIFGVI